MFLNSNVNLIISIIFNNKNGINNLYRLKLYCLRDYNLNNII